MVRSKRKWKKDSPEKLTQRIEKELVQLRKASPTDTHSKITSPETKKTKKSDIVPSDSSSDILADLKVTAMSSLPQKTSGLNNDPNNTTESENSVEILDDHSTNCSDRGEDKQITQEDKPQIENALSDITRALTTLTQTVANISVNMVSKSDISKLEGAISNQGTQINENTEKLKGMMTKEEGRKVEKKVKDHDSIM